MVGPQDGGFGFDQSKKYSSVENLDKICVKPVNTKNVYSNQKNNQSVIVNIA